MSSSVHSCHVCSGSQRSSRVAKYEAKRGLAKIDKALDVASAKIAIRANAERHWERLVLLLQVEGAYDQALHLQLRVLGARAAGYRIKLKGNEKDLDALRAVNDQLMRRVQAAEAKHRLLRVAAVNSLGNLRKGAEHVRDAFELLQDTVVAETEDDPTRKCDTPC